jgi:hypothetical protein
MKNENKREYAYTIHILNEVNLITRQMVKKCPPFTCHSLNFNETGISTRDFTVMLLGFGTIGQHALLRLVMNGQFVGSHMRAIIVDKNMHNLRNRFLHYYPHLKLCCDMDFKDFDVQNIDFFDMLHNIDYIDYIVVALSDDEMNKQVALDILLHYKRRDIANLPFIAILEENGNIQIEKQGGKIFCFGNSEDLYKESIIINEKTDFMAKAINDIYSGRKQEWHDLDWFSQESNRASADFIPAMLKLANCNEKDAAEKDNLTEDGTNAEILAQTEHLRWMAFHAAMGYSPINIEHMRQRFNRVSICNESNPLTYCRKDATARLHVCLAPWDELDKISMVYSELARRSGNSEEEKRDFKENDRDVIKNIPKFLRAAKSKE